MKEKWKLIEDGRNPSDAFTGGNDGEEPLYVGRVQFGGHLMPGKIMNGSCHISHEGKEYIIYEYEVLVNFLGEWLQTSGKVTPFRAIVGGTDLNGESYYIGRVNLSHGMTLGRVHPSHGCCYVPYANMEYKYENYEVLCWVKEVQKKSFCNIFKGMCNKKK